MTIKGNTIYVTTKDIKNARLGAAAVTELEDALLAAGYELSVETSDAKNTK
jgi:hypothetical protein